MKPFPVIFGLAAVVAASAADDANLRAAAERALRRGVEFFRSEVAFEGTYLWQYSEDLLKREGEGVATATQAWVQPPGTPAVGLALLAAWEATGDRHYLDAVRETAHGLLRGQLRSGGWAHSFDLSPEGRRRADYRIGGGGKGRNVTTLDDDSTQCALRFLMSADRALEFQDEAIREAIAYAIEALLAAQYPNGAWPQGFIEPPDAAKFPVKPASFPDDWPREYPGSQEYWFRYTLNDNAIATLVETLFLAGHIYGDGAGGGRFRQLAARCRAAAAKAGDFLLLAQLPGPQPGWAQQYDFDMHPAWARKFEPPAVTGGEARSALSTLLLVYRETGLAKYLEPFPRALDYYRRARLPDGRLARFYEMGSNRPLYFTLDYALTFDDGDMPTHYAFKVPDWTGSMQHEYEWVKALPADRLSPAQAWESPGLTPAMLAEVKAIIAAQDDQGRWVEEGSLRYHRPKDPTIRVINASTFNRHVETLSRYLVTTKSDSEQGE